MAENTLDQATDALATAREPLLALDFDGTLADLVDNPDEARMRPDARQPLEALTSSPGVTVALVSGRGLDSLTHVSEPDHRWWLIGSHGIEVRGPSNGGAVDIPTADPALRQRVWDDFETVAAGFPGVWVEKKPWGAALHTRSVSTEVEAEVHRLLWALIDHYGSTLTTREGHGILESALQSQTKGDGLNALREVIRPDRVLFIGDDKTDEDALAVLTESDVGIKVGPGPSLASHRLGTPADVAVFLADLARRRRAGA